MGQYFEAYVADDLNNNKLMRVFSPSDVCEGLRLTEHGRIGGQTVQSVLKLIIDAPKRVAWIGDYALDQKDCNGKRVAKKFLKLAGNPEEDGYYSPIDPIGIDNVKEYAGYFLFNHTKKQYVDYRHFIFENAKVWLQREDIFHVAEQSVFCLDPLPLLTCCSNGMGGGDYRGRDEGQCGTWAGDLIEFKYIGMRYRRNDFAVGYKEICPGFTESY